MNTDHNELNRMGERSRELASGYNLEVWRHTLKSTISSFFDGVKHRPLKRTKYQ
jgi:hypothetical protein